MWRPVRIGEMVFDRTRLERTGRVQSVSKYYVWVLVNGRRVPILKRDARRGNGRNRGLRYLFRVA